MSQYLLVVAVLAMCVPTAFLGATALAWSARLPSAMPMIVTLAVVVFVAAPATALGVIWVLQNWGL